MSENLNGNLRRSPRRSLDRKSVDKNVVGTTGKRSLNSRSPKATTPNGSGIGKDQRSSDKKRHNSKVRAPLSPVITSNINDNNNLRRETVDAGELQAFLDDSIVSNGSAPMSVASSNNSPNDSRRCTVDPEAFASMMSAIETEEVKETSISLTRRLSQSEPETMKAKAISRSNTPTKAIQDNSRYSLDSVTNINMAIKGSNTNNNRRETCDTADIAAIIDDIDDDINKNDSITSTSINLDNNNNNKVLDNRRLTADGADMAALMADLENDNLATSTDNINNGGRDSLASINTQDLVNQVGNMLNNDDGDTGRMSMISDMSSRRSSLATVNTQDLANLLEEDQTVTMNGNINRESFDTVDTADLLKSVQQVCADDEVPVKSTTKLMNEVEAPVQEVSKTNNSPGFLQKVLDDVSTVVVEEKEVEIKSSVKKGRRSSIGSKSNEKKNTVVEEKKSQSTKKEKKDKSSTKKSPRDSLLLPSNKRSSRRLSGKNPEEYEGQTMNEMLDEIQGAPSSPIVDVIAMQKKAEAAGLRSCLSNRKQSARKSVVFGSPKAAEFKKEDPTTSYTPMERSHIKEFFSMEPAIQEPENEETAENSAILEEWDRLTNTSANGSDDDAGSPEAVPIERSPRTSSSRRRRSKLQPNIDMNEEENTVALPDNLMSLVKDHEQIVPMVIEEVSTKELQFDDEHTADLEQDLHSMMKEVGYSMPKDLDHSMTYAEDDNNSVASSRASRRISNNSDQQDSLGSQIQSSGDEDGVTVTVQLEANLAELMNVDVLVPTDQVTIPEPAESSIVDKEEIESQEEDDNTAQLEVNLDAVLHAVTSESDSGTTDQSGSVSTCDNTRDSIASADTAPLEQDVVTAGRHSSLSVGSMDTAPLSPRNKSSRLSLDPSDLSNDNGGRMSVSTPSALFQRLQNLNAAARTTRLSHCETPLAANSRMSIGMKKHSMMTSASRIQNTAQKVKSALKDIQGDADEVDVAPRLALTSRMSLAGEIEPEMESEAMEVFVNSPSLVSKNEVSVDEVSIPAPIPISAPLVKEAVKVPVVTNATIPKDGPAVTLFELLDLVGLGDNESDNVNDVAPSLSDTIQIVINSCDEQASSTITNTMDELLADAVEQFPVQDANMGALTELWDSEFEAHKRAKLALKDVKESEQLKPSAILCKRAAQAKWEEWEAHILENGSKVLDEQLQQVIAQKNSLSANLQEKEEFCLPYEAVSSSGLSPEEHLSKLRQQLREARESLEQSRKELLDLGTETSDLLDARKTALKESAAEQASIVVTGKTKIPAAIAQMEVLDVELHGLNTAISVAGNLTWTRVKSFLGDRVEALHQLAGDLAVRLVFEITNINGGLTVNALSPILVGDSTAADSKLARAFMNDVITSEMCNGPLSETALCAVSTLLDMQRLLRRMGGYVSSFRTVLASLTPFTTDGWSWSVIRDDSGHGTYVVVKSPYDNYYLQLPLLVIVNGDISSLSSTSLRNINGEIVAQRDIAALIRSLAVRSTTPFGAFPTSLLKRETAKIIRTILG